MSERNDYWFRLKVYKQTLCLGLDRLLEGNPMKGAGLDPAPWAVSDDTPRMGAVARRRREPIGDEDSRSQMRGTGQPRRAINTVVHYVISPKTSGGTSGTSSSGGCS